MTTLKIGVYRDSERKSWRFAAWIDGRLDRVGPLDVSLEATEDQALQAARKILPALACERTIARLEDFAFG